jgi:hypothetical protein
LGLIDYLINQPNKPNPFKYPKQHSINYLGPLSKRFDTILKAHNQKHKAQPIKIPYTVPNKPSGPIMRESWHYSQAQRKLT